MNLPLQLYDFISVMVPGILALIIIKVEYPSWVIWFFDPQPVLFVALFSLSYIGGQLLQAASKPLWKIIECLCEFVLTEKKRLGPVAVADLAATTTEDTTGQTLFGRQFAFPVSPSLASEISAAVKEFYGIDVCSLNPQHKELFDLVYSPVYERMGQRSVFVAIANLCRCLAAVLSLYIVFLFLKLFYLWLSPNVYILWRETVLLIGLVFLSLILSIQNKRYFNKLSDRIPFIAFLAWFKFQKQNGN